MGLLQGESLLYLPRAKAPDFAKLRRGWLFGVTYHNMRGAIASATAAWANLFSRCAAIHASTSGLTLVPWRKMSKHQSAAGDARATMWDQRPRPSDCRKRLGNCPNSMEPHPWAALWRERLGSEIFAANRASLRPADRSTRLCPPS